MIPVALVQGVGLGVGVEVVLGVGLGGEVGTVYIRTSAEHLSVRDGTWGFS